MPIGFAIGDRMLSIAGDSHPFWNMAYGALPPYQVLGASAIGKLHVAQGNMRDDAFVIRSAGPWLAVGVADGVGSRSLSRYGAAYIADSLTIQLLRHFAPPVQPEENPASRRKRRRSKRKTLAPPAPPEASEPAPGAMKLGATGSVAWWTTSGRASGRAKTSPITSSQAPSSPESAPADQPSSASSPTLADLVRQAFEKTHLGLKGYARYLGVDLSELGSTALALLLNTETGVGIAGQVGDGALLGVREDGSVGLLADLGEEEGFVHSITSSNWERNLVVGPEWGPPASLYRAYFVMTDGISGDLLYLPPDKMAAWIGKVEEGAKRYPCHQVHYAAAALLNWLATYQVKGSFDDRTLVIVTRRNGVDADGSSGTG